MVDFPEEVSSWYFSLILDNITANEAKTVLNSLVVFIIDRIGEEGYEEISSCIFRLDAAVSSLKCTREGSLESLLFSAATIVYHLINRLDGFLLFPTVLVRSHLANARFLDSSSDNIKKKLGALSEEGLDELSNLLRSVDEYVRTRYDNS